MLVSSSSVDWWMSLLEYYHIKWGCSVCLYQNAGWGWSWLSYGWHYPGLRFDRSLTLHRDKPLYAILSLVSFASLVKRLKGWVIYIYLSWFQRYQSMSRVLVHCGDLEEAEQRDVLKEVNSIGSCSSNTIPRDLLLTTPYIPPLPNLKW